MTTMEALGIRYRQVPATPVATTRLQAKSRADLRAALRSLAERLPAGDVDGPAFCIYQFISSYTEGFDAEVGFPLRPGAEIEGVQTRTMPGMQVLSLRHEGPLEALRQRLISLYDFAADQGIISDEFRREVYWDHDDPEGQRIELEFVIHDWQGLLAGNAARVLGAEAGRQIVAGGQAPGLESSVDERFQWIKGAVGRLEGLAGDDQRYEVLSRCAHVFPRGQIAKLGTVFEQTRHRTGDAWQAVDAVLAFMIEDPGWGVRPVRRGTTIYATKNPRDPQAHARATSDAERKRAYCFCPLVRDHLDGGMPDTFCYCSAGWERQQWEGAIGRPVRVRVSQSLLKGDEVCSFAIELPADL
jgi:effector-binding domain-containing protein